MKQMVKWYSSLSKRTRDSISFSVFFIGIVSTLFTILGFSLGDVPGLTYLTRILIVVIAAGVVYIASYVFIGYIFKDKIGLKINNT